MPGQCLNEYWLIVQSESGNRTWKVVLISRFASVKSVWVCRLQMATVFVQASICWRRYLSYIQKSLKLWAYVLRLTATVKNMYINGNWCGTVVSQLLTHWSYSGLAQSLYCCCCCWGDGGGGVGVGEGGCKSIWAALDISVSSIVFQWGSGRYPGWLGSTMSVSNGGASVSADPSPGACTGV